MSELPETNNNTTEEVIVNESQQEEGLQEAEEVKEVLDSLDSEADDPTNDVRAAYELLTEGAKEEDETKQVDEQSAKREARAKLFGQKSKPQEPKQQQGQPQAADLEIGIPVGLDANERADFVKLPPTQQKAVKRILDSAASKFTRTQQELRESLTESEDVIKAIKPHMRAWGLKGVTPAQVITQLAHAQNVLTENRAEAIISLANEADIDLAELAKQQRGEVSDHGIANIDQHPKFRALQEQLNSINNRFQQVDQQQNSQVVESKAAEVRRFAAEKDALGGQKYPRLQDESFFQRWKQLVIKLGEITPEAEFSERLNTAYRTLAPNDFIPSTTPTRLPSTNGRDAIARAKAANVSVRGAGGLSEINQITTAQIPDSAEATARMAYEMLTGRQLS